MIKDKERADMKITKLEEEVSNLKLENSNDKTTSLDENDHEMREGDNLDSSAQKEKTDNLINQLHGEIASLKVELSNCETNQEESIEKLEEKVATLNRQLGEERKNSKTLQENFESEKAKSEKLAINLELKNCETNPAKGIAKLVEKVAALNRQLGEERKNSKILQENFEAEKAKSENLATNLELKNCETNPAKGIAKLVEKVATLNRQLGEERQNSKTLQENFDAEKAKSESLNTNLVVEQTNSKIHLANQLREEKRFQAQLREEEKNYKTLQENFDAELKKSESLTSQLEVEQSNSKTLKENLDFTLKNLGQVRAENSRQLEEERKKYKSLQEDCNAQLVKSKDYASKLWRETQRDTTILREELEEERKKFNDLQKNFDTEVLSDSKALTQNLTRRLGEEQKNLKVMKDSFTNLQQECSKHKVRTFRIFRLISSIGCFCHY